MKRARIFPFLQHRKTYIDSASFSFVYGLERDALRFPATVTMFRWMAPPAPSIFHFFPFRSIFSVRSSIQLPSLCRVGFDSRWKHDWILRLGEAFVTWPLDSSSRITPLFLLIVEKAIWVLFPVEKTQQKKTKKKRGWGAFIRASMATTTSGPTLVRPEEHEFIEFFLGSGNFISPRLWIPHWHATERDDRRVREDGGGGGGCRGSSEETDCEVYGRSDIFLLLFFMCEERK